MWMQKKTNKNFFNRNKMSKGTIVFSVVLTVLSFVCAFLCSCYLNSETVLASQGQGTVTKTYYLIKILNDVLVVFFSVFGTNLILTLCVEKKSRNKAFDEFFMDEIISSQSFYEHLQKQDKEKMLNALEMERYYNNEIKRDICNRTREKIISNSKSYYFADCSYNVTVKDKGNYFEKTVIYSVTIEPYEQKEELNNFVLAQVTNKKIYGLDIVEINSIEYNGDDITEKCVTDNIPIDIKFGEKKDFDNTTQVAFEECFTITKDNPAKFIVNLTTRCPKEDITSSFRASVPCKQFSVNYKIESDIKENSNTKLIVESVKNILLEDQ